MLMVKETIDMSARRDDPGHHRTTVRAVLIAGAGQVGIDGATTLLDRLPELRRPIIVSLRNADIDHLRSRIDGVRTQWVTHGSAVDDASLWIAPPDRHTFVRKGRFELSGPESTSPATMPSLGKLYHSMRVEYGSRVFAVVIDENEPNRPTLRLLAQRGACVVSPLEAGPDDIAQHWSQDRIVDHLSDTLALSPGDTVALA